LIADLPDGVLTLDLINEKATHSNGSAPTFWITGELAAWLRHRLEVHNIPASAIQTASLVVAYSTDRIKTNRKKIISFDFSCHSSITTESTQYTGELVEKHTYHQRLSCRSSDLI
jgi:hypothetical protein